MSDSFPVILSDEEIASVLWLLAGDPLPKVAETGVAQMESYIRARHNLVRKFRHIRDARAQQEILANTPL